MSHLSCSISPALLVELSAKDVIGKTMMTSSSSSVYWCRERNKFGCFSPTNYYTTQLLRSILVFRSKAVGTGDRRVFPRDGMSQDKTGRDVPLSVCPGTKKCSCPGIPLSWDKGRSKNTRTNFSVPGRPWTK